MVVTKKKHNTTSGEDIGVCICGGRGADAVRAVNLRVVDASLRLWLFELWVSSWPCASSEREDSTF